MSTFEEDYVPRAESIAGLDHAQHSSFGANSRTPEPPSRRTLPYTHASLDRDDELFLVAVGLVKAVVSTGVAYHASFAGVVDFVIVGTVQMSVKPYIGMLEEIQSDLQEEPAPEGASYVSRYRVKHRPSAV